jgi:hypothetical protein
MFVTVQKFMGQYSIYLCTKCSRDQRRSGAKKAVKGVGEKYGNFLPNHHCPHFHSSELSREYRGLDLLADTDVINVF